MSVSSGMRKKKGSFLAWGALAIVVALIFAMPLLKKPEEKKPAEKQPEKKAEGKQ